MMMYYKTLPADEAEKLLKKYHVSNLIDISKHLKNHGEVAFSTIEKTLKQEMTKPGETFKTSVYYFLLSYVAQKIEENNQKTQS